MGAGHIDDLEKLDLVAACDGSGAVGRRRLRCKHHGCHQILSIVCDNVGADTGKTFKSDGRIVWHQTLAAEANVSTAAASATRFIPRPHLGCPSPAIVTAQEASCKAFWCRRRRRYPKLSGRTRL